MTQQDWVKSIVSGEDEAAANKLLAAEERLRALGFHDGRAAARSLRRLAATSEQREAFERFAPHLLAALATAGSPDHALAAFERFLHSARQPLEMYGFLAARPRAVEMLVRLFSGSQFLGEILLRNPEYFETLIQLRRLAQPKTREQLTREARRVIEPLDGPADRLDALRRWQRWELLRIGVCDLLDLFDLKTATAQLSHLADSLVQVCLEVSAAQLGLAPDALCVIGMGKLGGQELNYSSDIDFLFLAETPSPAVARLGQRLIDALAQVTTEGFLYRVDLRLRPWGKVGPLVASPDSFVAYLARHALQWEKQALLKARVAAGSRAVGEDFLSRARGLMFDGVTESVRLGVFEMKQRTEAFLQQKGRAWGNVKLGEGSIRDVEFVVQFLQLAHGGRQPEILSPNTLDGLARCQQGGLLTVREAGVLADGYVFLRTIEHHLQMMDYRQTHTLPENDGAIGSLARRLGFEGEQAGAAFLARYRQHAAAIREIYLRTVGRIEMQQMDLSPSGSAAATDEEISQHRARMSPSYVERFGEAEIKRHAALSGQLGPERLAVVVVDAHPMTRPAWEVTIVAYDFPGELSLICGLLYIYGLDIVKGDVFTYEPQAAPAGDGQGAAAAAGGRRRANRARRAASAAAPAPDTRRKIVDVFSVRPTGKGKPTPELWLDYARELEELLRMVQAGQRREARGLLAKRVGTHLIESGHAAGEVIPALLPIGIEIDNEASEAYTVLRIDTPDTAGFLYEFTNALAINRVYIARVSISSVGRRVSDTLYVTDEAGGKITGPERVRELRAATVLVKHFTHLLPLSPNPESALLHFREFLAELFKRPNWPDELGSLERPEVLQAIARLLGVSDFLWDDFLRMQYANLYPVVTGVDALTTAKTRAQLQAELEAILAGGHAGPQPPVENAPWREALNAFKDREMFRIDMRHILGHTSEFWDFAAELTGLAEVVVNAVYHLCHEDLRQVYGSPRLENGEVCEMSVCALGKFGGQELGFASDIELMFIYSGNGQTSGPQVITSAEFYEKLVQDFVRVVRARREGIFEIDLQLRPYGKAGSLAVSLDSFGRYFAPDGPAWAYERQALVKLRPVAGNPGLGRRVARLRDTYVYSGEPFDATAMRAMRERQVRHLVTGGTFNLKYSPGGLVDVEYLVQGLQMTHGHTNRELRQANTREALAALARAGHLSPDDHTRLRKAHTFLRWLIDALRVVRGNARDVNVPPQGSEEFAFLTRRMRYGIDVTRLRDELIRYTADVQEINKRLLG
jgi:glutamate-ammonia-ligase adenylyltransferase